MKNILFTISVLLFTLSCHSKKTVVLFNGSNLDGWYTFLNERGVNNDPKNVFTVEDGMIRISGEEWGCITTEKEYDNYKIILEYKWGQIAFDPRKDRARDSGLLLHSVGKDGAMDGNWMYSIECQMIEGGTGDFIVVGDGSPQFSITVPVSINKQGNSFVYDSLGQQTTVNKGRVNWYGRSPSWKDTINFRGPLDKENEIGEWNKLECVAINDEIKVFLNGTLVNHAFNVTPSKGKIQIQSEGAELFIRKVELIPL